MQFVRVSRQAQCAEIEISTLDLQGTEQYPLLSPSLPPSLISPLLHAACVLPWHSVLLAAGPCHTPCPPPPSGSSTQEQCRVSPHHRGLSLSCPSLKPARAYWLCLLAVGLAPSPVGVQPPGSPAPLSAAQSWVLTAHANFHTGHKSRYLRTAVLAALSSRPMLWSH